MSDLSPLVDRVAEHLAENLTYDAFRTLSDDEIAVGIVEVLRPELERRPGSAGTSTAIAPSSTTAATPRAGRWWCGAASS